MNPELPLPRRRGDLAQVQVDGDVVVYDPEVHALHVLNASAALVWDHCDGVTTMEKLLDDLGARFAASRSNLTADLTTALSELRGLHLLDS